MYKLKQRKLLFVIAGLVLICTAAAYGQENEINKITKFIKKKRVNAAYAIGGLNRLSLNTLNHYLDKGEFPHAEKTHFCFGLGGHVIHNKLVLGLVFQRFLPRKQETEKEFTTSTSAKYTVLNVGYLVYSKKGLMIYPLAGLGLGELRLRITENNIQSFADIAGYQKGSDSKTRSILVNLGAGADYFFNFNKKKKGKNNLMMGVRMGYLISTIKYDWRVNYAQVADGPAAGLTGPYFHVVIGLGGWVEKLIRIALK
jgi:hypothetical protein